MDYHTNTSPNNHPYSAGSMSPPHAFAMDSGMGSTHGHGHYAQGPTGYAGHPMYPPRYPQQSGGLLNERFLKGLLIGAAAAYILTHENVQRTAIKGAVKAWSLLQGGVEELKERFRDAEAEIRAESSE